MMKPRKVLPALPAAKFTPLPLLVLLPPSSSISGIPANPGWLHPSKKISLAISGNCTAPTEMVRTPVPLILKEMVSSPAVLLAAMMASRSDTALSAPLLALSCSMLKLLPKPLSLASDVVVTTSTFDTSSTVTAMACVSVALPSLTCTVTSKTLFMSASEGISKSGGAVNANTPVLALMLKRAASAPPLML